jgi:multidrug efflux pump subunit AcrA (membrane-fusion protein)
VTAETDFLAATVDRLSGLAASANIPQKEFLAAKSSLLRAQLQGEKDVYAAEADLRTARRNLAAVERSLAQAGAEPDMLGKAAEKMAVIAADVPELKIGLVRVDQRSEIRFYGLPDRSYPGHVELIGSTVTPERRTLRVFLHIEDADSELRPGMFGEVSIGTDEREAIRVLETSVLHLDLQDYVLTAAGADTWRAKPVRIGEGQSGFCDVIEGLEAGDTVISGGAILLKSLLTQSFQENREPTTDPPEAGEPVVSGSAP